jgi:NTE family protein
MGQHALVLGAGGHAAIAWELGVVTGMADAGIDVRDADLIVGTSAGARVGAQIRSDLGLEDLFRQQVDPHLQTKEPAPPVDFMRWRADFVRAKEGSGDAVAVLKRFGDLALKMPSDLHESRRNRIAQALPSHSWPERRLLIVAVDVESGERRTFDRSILTLPARVPPLCVASLDAAVDTLRRSGARVDVVHPDEVSQAAFASVGGNLLDPSVREAAARAGREQGRRVAVAGAGR